MEAPLSTHFGPCLRPPRTRTATLLQSSLTGLTETSYRMGVSRPMVHQAASPMRAYQHSWVGIHGGFAATSIVLCSGSMHWQNDIASCQTNLFAVDDLCPLLSTYPFMVQPYFATNSLNPSGPQAGCEASPERCVLTAGATFTKPWRCFRLRYSLTRWPASCLRSCHTSAIGRRPPMLLYLQVGSFGGDGIDSDASDAVPSANQNTGRHPLAQPRNSHLQLAPPPPP